MSNTSYYLYMRYIKYGNQEFVPVYPVEYAISGDSGQNPVIKQENDPNCGYCEPEYRWKAAPIGEEYICSGGNKYFIEYYQVSNDCGFNWENTESARTGSLYESGSSDCIEYRWVNMDISTDWVCSGTSKYYKQKKQWKYTDSSTWIDVYPAEYRKGDLYEYESTDCGYIPPDYSKRYLTFIPTSGSSTFGWAAPSAASANTVYYSLDRGSTWSGLSSGETVTVNQGDKIYWKATNLVVISGSSGGIGHFSSSGKFDVEGNIMSLVSGDNFSNATTIENSNQFAYLMAKGVVNAENLILPATTLTSYCYRGMFYNCTSLTTAPELPATTLENYCYYYMFYNCTSLTTAPVISAATLADRCCEHMFASCRSLIETPELPATTLAEACYAFMFQNCTSLTTVHVLPATTLAGTCYWHMFQDCTSLVSVPTNMLPATQIATQCYCLMFSGCTSLTTAPELPATDLRLKNGSSYRNSSCYQYMFYGCTSLNYIKMLAIYLTTYQGASIDTEEWVNGVSSSGTFVKSSNATWYNNATGVIPSGWSVQNYS